MLRPALFPAMTVLICFTAATLAQTQTDDTAVPAEPPTPTNMDLVAVVEALEKRVARLEKHLAARIAQKSLGRGLIAMQPIVANLQSENLTRYIRVAIVLGVDDGQQETARKALQSVQPHIKSWLYGHLADKTVSDVTGGKNQDLLRTEILNGINSQFRQAGHAEFVNVVLFNEINVQ